MTNNELDDYFKNTSASDILRRTRIKPRGNRPAVRIDGLPRKQRSSKK